MAEKSVEYSSANGFESKTPFLIGVAGGTASGKSTVCQRIMEKLGQQHKEQTERRVVCISQDSFYRTLTPSERLRAERGQFNFDHPDAFDDKNLLTVLKDILAGKKVEVPEYDYITNSINPHRSHTIYPADVVLIEGILVFYFPEVRDLFHMKLFVDTDSDTRLARRAARELGLEVDLRVTSAHKATEETLRIMQQYEDTHGALVFIAVAGRSNGLGPVLSGNTSYPVINCPPPSDKLVQDIWSSLSVPSGLGCATVIYPDSAALMAAQIIGLQDYIVWARLRVKQLDMAAALRQADKKLRN